MHVYIRYIDLSSYIEILLPEEKLINCFFFDCIILLILNAFNILTLWHNLRNRDYIKNLKQEYFINVNISKQKSINENIFLLYLFFINCIYMI